MPPNFRRIGGWRRRRTGRPSPRLPERGHRFPAGNGRRRLVRRSARHTARRARRPGPLEEVAGAPDRPLWSLPRALATSSASTSAWPAVPGSPSESAVRNGPLQRSASTSNVRRFSRALAPSSAWRPHQQGQLTRAGAGRLRRGTARVVRRQHVFRHLRRRRALHEEARPERRDSLGQAVAVVEQRLGDRDGATVIGVDRPRPDMPASAGSAVQRRCSPRRARCRRTRPAARLSTPRPDRAAPVLHEERDVAQADGVRELGHPLHVPVHGVRRALPRLVGSGLQPDEVGRRAARTPGAASRSIIVQ